MTIKERAAQALAWWTHPTPDKMPPVPDHLDDTIRECLRMQAEGRSSEPSTVNNWFLVGPTGKQAAEIPSMVDQHRRIEELEEENRKLAAWQCPFHDGTGLTGDENGSQVCLKDKELRLAKLVKPHPDSARLEFLMAHCTAFFLGAPYFKALPDKSRETIDNIMRVVKERK